MNQEKQQQAITEKRWMARRIHHAKWTGKKDCRGCGWRRDGEGVCLLPVCMKQGKPKCK